MIKVICVYQFSHRIQIALVELFVKPAYKSLVGFGRPGRFPLPVNWASHGGAHASALARTPHRTSTEEATIAMPTVRNPSVTRLSCHGCPLSPAPVIGERSAGT